MTPLPSWIDKEAWEGFTEMRLRQERQSKGKIAWTSRAEKLILKELYRLHDAGHDANAALDQSALKGWTDVYVSVQKEIPNVKREYNRTAEAPMTDAQKASAEEARRRAMSTIRRVA